MQFIKAHCGGNDFIILDSRVEKLPKDLNSLTQHLTERHTGIGADGVIVIAASGEPRLRQESVKGARMRLRYFNPDGSEYGICGNGSLCVLIYEKKSKVVFETKSGLINGCIVNNKPRIKVPSPKNIKLSLLLVVKKRKYDVSFVDLGVPHTILSVPDINSVNIIKFGQAIRFHPYFRKSGTNVNFTQIINKNKMFVRTYERGIEGETLSCGSGILSASIAGWLKGDLLSPIEITTGGGKYRVYIGSLEKIWLEGSPKIIHKGEYYIK
ncbi:diaminopimelate epimerase [candidate division WOR-3 bacterium]|nr:diaminopimelate epimerase [candidate division WOR-3 bacterium]